MVAKITTPNSIGKALNYNEKKVQKGVATCLYAGNFLKDANDLNFYEKLTRFKALNSLNTRAKTNTLHISLNFDPTERLCHEKLVQIATTYLVKIGFGEQPYLVYEHRDAGHPHIHIVTTSIRENGRRIDTYNIGKNASEKARTEIEVAFGLVRTSRKRGPQKQSEETPATQKIQYGKTGSKRAITNVLNTVIHGYSYSSLAELNAVLKLYNLWADTGAEGSRIQKNGGLLYRILNESGQPVGVPIKASSLSFKPTLPYLENAFKKGAEAKEPNKKKLKTAINFQLLQKPEDLADFIRRLQNEKITVVLRKNSQQYVYGLTYVDHRTKSVFNGSDLGKDYSAAGIQKRIAEGQENIESKKAMLLQKSSQSSAILDKRKSEKQPLEELLQKQERAKEVKEQQLPDLLHQLLKTEKDLAYLPYELRKKKKKNGDLHL